MIEVPQEQFQQMGFTHFVDHKNGRTTCFSLENCENCNEVIQAANALGGSAKDITYYLDDGMIEMPSLPPEGYYSDALEGEACDACNG